MRGAAIIWMVWFETFDFFSKDFKLFNEYWYKLGFDVFNWLPMFITVSGVSIWIVANKKASIGMSRINMFLTGIERYGLFIALSLFISLWVADLQLFLTFGEVVGAIGLYAIIALSLLLVLRNHKLLLLVGAIAVSFFLREYASNYLVGMRISPFFYGFTIWNMLPFFVTGIYLAESIQERNIKKILTFASFLAPLLTLLTIFGNTPSYWYGTLSFVTVGMITVALLFSIITRFEKCRLFKPIIFFGKHSLTFYFFHVAVWYKLCLTFGVVKTFDITQSFLLTAASVAVPAVLLLAKDRLPQRINRASLWHWNLKKS